MKRGFTLIELLAVIVILAIIALIAVPIVLNIINNSKESASLRSAELYVKAVEYAIANKILDEGSIDDDQYPIMSNGSICLKNYNYDEETKEETCNGDDINSKDNESVLIVEVSGEYPKEGFVAIEKGQVVKELSDGSGKKTELVISGKPIVKNDNNEFVLAEDKKIVCKVDDVNDNGVANVGEEVICDFSSTVQKFYIIEDVSLNENNGILKMLTMYNLDVGYTNSGVKNEEQNWTLTPIQNPTGIQKEIAKGYFSGATSIYGVVPVMTWSYTGEGGSCGDPVYVYDDNSNLAIYVNNYVDFLETGGLNVISGGLMSLEQAMNLGCENGDDSHSCATAPSWLRSNSFALGSINCMSPMYISQGFIGDPSLICTGNNYLCDYGLGVRPVITIKTTELGY